MGWAICPLRNLRGGFSGSVTGGVASCSGFFKSCRLGWDAKLGKRPVVNSPFTNLRDYGEPFCFTPEEPEDHGDAVGICYCSLFFQPWQERCLELWKKSGEGLDYCPPPEKITKQEYKRQFM